MKVDLKWATTDGDAMIAEMARVSAPENVGNDSVRLIGYLLRNKHVSPFEMVNACLYIETTRDIGRQILRHRSFSFQEFSQRYASVEKLERAPLRECRLQDTKNRQSSLPVPADREHVADWWRAVQEKVQFDTEAIYQHALHLGIAKEQARAILPEGLTPTRMFMNGNLRSWLHFCDLRMSHGTQTECMEVAKACYAIISERFPATCAAWDEVRAG